MKGGAGGLNSITGQNDQELQIFAIFASFLASILKNQLPENQNWENFKNPFHEKLTY